MNADDYRKLSSDELVRRFKHLDADTSTMTMEAECARMYAVQEIATVLAERGVKVYA